MANITVRVSDDVYRRARVHAARNDTSVSALVAAFLTSLEEDDAELRRLEALETGVLDRLATAGRGVATRARPTRDELYEAAIDRRQDA